MKPRPPVTPRAGQATSQELLDALCDFVRRKFYPTDPVEFAKDRPRLLKWVILYPAKWLDERSVTMPPDRYRAVLESVLMDALRFGATGQITYRPAWLAQVVQSHFRAHGEEYYETAKALRDLAPNALRTILTNRVAPPPDPVRELALAARLLKTKKRKSQQSSPPVNPQLTLL